MRLKLTSSCQKLFVCMKDFTLKTDLLSSQDAFHVSCIKDLWCDLRPSSINSVWRWPGTETIHVLVQPWRLCSSVFVLYRQKIGQYLFAFFKKNRHWHNIFGVFVKHTKQTFCVRIAWNSLQLSKFQLGALLIFGYLADVRYCWKQSYSAVWH